MAYRLHSSWLPQEIPSPESLESPLPGGVAALVRFFLNFPQPLQIAGVAFATLAAGVVAIVVWRRRRALATWITTRPRLVYAWTAGIGALLVVLGAAGGLMGWNYVQHDNGFCTGCHVMGPAFVRFTESEHSQLECHACHEQPVWASMRQLYLWVVERPADIGPHARVPTEVCARCHIQDDANETWEAISQTQGHAVHLSSDSTALADVQCVTCHATEVHQFVPAEETCAQSGCHALEETRIVLGDMSGAQTSFHCLGCHQFTAPLPADAGQALVPALGACAGCHDMDPLLSQFASESDPHQAVCGMCHDPHSQTRPADAWATCTSAGCHQAPELLTPFHRGLHDDVVQECSACHSAHGWVVDGDDCRSCHATLPD